MSLGDRYGLPMRRVLTTGTMIIIDQGLFSAGLISTVMLARWMSPESFGVFTIVQSLAQVTIAVHSSLLLEPMSVLAGTTFKSRDTTYTRIQLRIHLWLSFLLSLLAVPFLWVVLSSAQVNLVMVAAAFILCHPLYLSIWFARRYCYNRGGIAAAARISGVYLVATPAALLFLDRAGYLTSVTAWVAGALCGAIASSATFLSMHRVIDDNETALSVGEVVGEHWTFGGWYLIATITFLIAQQLPVFAMTRWIGPESAGAFRALNLLVLPLALLIPPASSALLPVVVAAQSRGDQRHAIRISTAFSVGLASLALIYVFLCYWFAEPAIHLLYGTKYEGMSWLVPVLGLANIASGIIAGCSVLLRAARRTQLLAISTTSMLIIAILGTVTLVRPMGLVGAVYTIVLAYMASAGSTLLIYGWWRRRRL
jgi:O-antigen/teichoic acid export membrane protein